MLARLLAPIRAARRREQDRLARLADAKLCSVCEVEPVYATTMCIYCWANDRAGP